MILSKNFPPGVALIATKGVSSPCPEPFFSDFILLVFFPTLIITSLPASVCGHFCSFYYFFSCLFVSTLHTHPFKDSLCKCNNSERESRSNFVTYSFRRTLIKKSIFPITDKDRESHRKFCYYQS